MTARATEKFGFVSLLSSDNYLPGLLVLHKSLQLTKSLYKFEALLTPNISKNTIQKLIENKIEFSIIDNEINNPTDVNRNHRWYRTYSKLAVFGQTKYSKLVYLDADMLVLRNIDELFCCPHMSATNAGGMLPRKSSWTHLNSGLLVIEPSKGVFEDMLNKVGTIETLASGGTFERPKCGSDQDFLNAYYTDWQKDVSLHLDHKYNMFHYYLDEYHKLFGYTLDDGPKEVKVIHFASFLKPWDIDCVTLQNEGENKDRQLEFKSIELWLNLYNKI